MALQAPQRLPQLPLLALLLALVVLILVLAARSPPQAACRDDEVRAALLQAYRRQLDGAARLLEGRAGRAVEATSSAAAEGPGGPGGPGVTGSGEALPRMHLTQKRLALASDVENWSRRPRRAPTHAELYAQVYGARFGETDNVVASFSNPYGKQPHMKYPHSSIWLAGDKVMRRLVAELGRERLRFVVEAGSMHGGSAIRMAMELDKLGLAEVPILCIDPWTGDLNMWLNRVVWEHLGVRDGRATTYDQFMVNVRQAIADHMISPHHIVPFPVSSVVGARWLQATGFTPSLVYLDSAHEIDETYYELYLFFDVLEPGGILMGDDYGWPAVRLDVDRFVKDKGLQLNMFGVYFNWFVRKPA